MTSRLWWSLNLLDTSEVLSKTRYFWVKEVLWASIYLKLVEYCFEMCIHLTSPCDFDKLMSYSKYSEYSKYSAESRLECYVQPKCILNFLNRALVFTPILCWIDNLWEIHAWGNGMAITLPLMWYSSNTGHHNRLRYVAEHCPLRKSHLLPLTYGSCYCHFDLSVCRDQGRSFAHHWQHKALPHQRPGI